MSSCLAAPARVRPAIAVDGLELTYPRGRVHALRGVDLEIAAGEMVAVTGPSGCGKSSLLHVIAGLVTPDRGRILVDGQDLSGLDERDRSELRRRRLGLVFQRFHLFGALTVDANLRLATWVLARDRHDHERMTRRRGALLARLGIAGRAGHRPGELSGGEQQRVAIARALLNDPSLLLADEPTGNLDSVATGQVIDLLAELNRGGQTILLITHDQAVAARATRRLAMVDGRVA